MKSILITTTESTEKNSKMLLKNSIGLNPLDKPLIHTLKKMFLKMDLLYLDSSCSKKILPK